MTVYKYSIDSCCLPCIGFCSQMLYCVTNKSYCSFHCIVAYVCQSENQLEFGYFGAHSQAQILQVGGQHGNEANHNYKMVALALRRSQ